MANKKSVSLKNEKVCNLYCSMNTVGSTYSESIDTSLNRERIYEQKNNYLYTETDELSLDNLFHFEYFHIYLHLDYIYYYFE